MDDDSDPSSLRTRASLLQRVRKWDDGTSWSEFDRLYRKLIHGFARRAGLPHADAEDVTQEVFQRVATSIREFEYDPARGSFRGWLMQLTRWRIADKFASRAKSGEAPASPPSGQAAGIGETSTVERVPAPAEVDAAWNEEWERHVFDAACERIARRVKARHFQIFDLHVCKNWPASEVARQVGANPATVYVISHRLKQQLKAEVKKLKLELE
jgi:RNA polymerase sigma factor (sigma-70 family)